MANGDRPRIIMLSNQKQTVAGDGRPRTPRPFPRRSRVVFPVAALLAMAGLASAAEPARPEISGRYPHLALFNHGDECGIGAVVPWANRLWAVTYSPHKPRGSDDKLVEIDAGLNLRIRPEGIGGTPANRLIHRESKQLFIGPYVIDAMGNVRVIPYDRALGRPTATVRHLADPANKVYTFTMEEGLYEIDVRTLEVTVIHPDGHAQGFLDYLPGYHGKGGYTGQGRVVVSNNGQQGATYEPFYKESGCLAEWDGRTWTVLETHQFNEVTGPGGIAGNERDTDPVWATGWDTRSVLLAVRDGGRWSRYRLPIGSYCYVAPHGWFTEWPRIRSVGPQGQYLMNMHGLWFDFPRTFAAGTTADLRPLASHLKITGDFCRWQDRLVFACDDTAITGGNDRFVNQSQSNFWFADWDRLAKCGQPAGWGGVWVRDDVPAVTASDPYHFAGYAQRMLHLSHDTDAEVRFTFERDERGEGNWTECGEVCVPPRGYAYHIFPETLQAEWVRVRVNRDCTAATAWFHYGPGGGSSDNGSRFTALADIEDASPQACGILRPRGGDLGTLQLLSEASGGASGEAVEPQYYEVGPGMEFKQLPEEAKSAAYLRETCALGDPDFTVDDASAVIVEGGRRYRLPVSHDGYREPWSIGWPRGAREVVTERRLLNCCGTFYVLPHASAGGVAGIKPVATHNKRISDYCSWRGMLVLAGTRLESAPDGHFFRSADGQAGLWFGDVDDLWSMGKPRGQGGPWRNTAVKAGEPSDAYLMTGYDRKSVQLSHHADRLVRFRVEVDFLRDGTWKTYDTIDVPAGERVDHQFPTGFSAHWVRVTVDCDCRATAWFAYE